MNSQQMPVETGTWSDIVSWEFYLSSELPPAELCTAVFCVAITPEGKVVLSRPERGWGMLGGHIEEGETLEAALVREAQEEGGFMPVNPHLFGYKKIIHSEPVPHQLPGKFYPFPHSYIVYYWATTDTPIVEHFGEEVLESGSFSVDEAKLLAPSSAVFIEHGYKSYLDLA